MSENRYFQYLASERQGEVVVFDRIEEEDGDVFVCFKDGARCNEELILPLNERNAGNMLMTEVSDPNNIWKFKTEWVGREEERWETNKDGQKVCVQPFVKGRKKVTQIPPRKVNAKFGNVNKHIETSDINPKELEKLQHANDPVWVMMEKAKKFDTQVPMELTISLPSKALYNVAKESFEEGGKKVIEYIISNIDDKKLKNSLKVALYSSYEDIEQPKPEESTLLFEPEAEEEAVIGDPILANSSDL